MRIGKYRIDRTGLYELAPPERAWIWDKIFPKFKYKREAFKKGNLAYQSHNFDSFFDETTGMNICSIEDIEAREKRGQVLITHDEAKKYADKRRNEAQQEVKRKSRQSMEKYLRRIKQGEIGIKVDPFL